MKYSFICAKVVLFLEKLTNFGTKNQEIQLSEVTKSVFLYGICIFFL